MKKSAIFSLLLLTLPLLLIQGRSASADTSVNISNNGDGSSNNVSVNSSTSTNYSGTSISTTNGHTSVRIESNGEVKTYEGDGNQSVHLQSSDGNSQVNINNSDNTSEFNGKLGPTLTQEQLDQQKADIKKKIEDEKAKIQATITAIPKPTVTPHHFNFDLGRWLRDLFASIFK